MNKRIVVSISALMLLFISAAADARELVRTVQDARKSAGLEVSDRIVLGVSGSAGVEAALAVHRDYLMAETLAVEWATDQSDPLFSESRTLDDEEWQIEISRIQNG